MADISARERHFERRQKAAREGLHLPSEEELLRGMGFFRQELPEDVREYAGRLSRRLKKRGRADLMPMVEMLEELVIDPGFDGIAAAEALLEDHKDSKWLPVDDCRLRFRIYRAFHGDPHAAAMVAGDTAKLALTDIRSDEKPDIAWRALGWSAHSIYLDAWKRNDIFAFRSWKQVDRELAKYESWFRDALVNSVEKELDQKKARDKDPVIDDPDGNDDEEDTPSATEAAAPRGVVVVRSIGNASTSDGKRVIKEFESLTDKELALKPVPDLAAVRSRLAAEFPYAATVIDTFLYALVGRGHVWFRPTLLLGSPGCGKTRFARRLAEELALPYELISCGGMSDSAIGGTARRWSSGEPSLAIMAIRRHECAGPIIIIDEIEKVGSSRHNGNVHDVLVGLFEKETSGRWHDPYLESHCDLSHVSWLMTANSADPIPGVLRDRCRIVDFPEPTTEEVRLLAPRILERLYLEAGHDRRWAAPLDEQELVALADAWGGGSIRRLERLVEGLIDIRERQRPRQ